MKPRRHSETRRTRVPNPNFEQMVCFESYVNWFKMLCPINIHISCCLVFLPSCSESAIIQMRCHSQTADFSIETPKKASIWLFHLHLVIITALIINIVVWLLQWITTLSFADSCLDCLSVLLALLYIEGCPLCSG